MPNKRNSINRMLNRTIQKPNGCIEWQGYVDKDGYARSSLEGYSMSAAKVMYILINGCIEDNLQVDHKCKNKLCKI